MSTYPILSFLSLSIFLILLFFVSQVFLHLCSCVLLEHLGSLGGGWLLLGSSHGADLGLAGIHGGACSWGWFAGHSRSTCLVELLCSQRCLQFISTKGSIHGHVTLSARLTLVDIVSIHWLGRVLSREWTLWHGDSHFTLGLVQSLLELLLHLLELSRCLGLINLGLV